MGATPANQVDWAAIRHVYETDHAVTIKAICERFAVSKGALENRCRRDLWVSRQGSAAKRQSAIRYRVFVLLERQLAAFDRRGDHTLTDVELRQVSDIVRSLDRMAKTENASRGKSASTAKAEPATRKDIAELRNKLIKRLEEFKRR